MCTATPPAAAAFGANFSACCRSRLPPQRMTVMVDAHLNVPPLAFSCVEGEREHLLHDCI